MRNNKRRVLWRIMQVLIASVVAVAIIAAFTYVTQGREIPVLDPKGVIAEQQYVLILITVGLGAFVIIPVFILLFSIAWRYRAENTKAKYDPELDGHVGLEILWWGIPIIIIVMLAIITYITSHTLDPYRELESDKPPVTVKVIATERDWVFLYPEYNVATLNYMNIPEDTPINLSITADAPMNTFWVPALAGQVYAMAGMNSKLHLMANEPGTYMGTTTNISGEGYADLRFKVYSKTEADFKAWAEQASATPNLLTNEAYALLLDAEANHPETTYALIQRTLYEDVIAKYMNHTRPSTEGKGTEKSDSQTKTEHEGMRM